MKALKLALVNGLDNILRMTEEERNALGYLDGPEPQQMKRLKIGEYCLLIFHNRGIIHHDIKL